MIFATHYKEGHVESQFVGLFLVFSTNRPASFYLGEKGRILYRWYHQDMPYYDTKEVAENPEEAREKAEEWARTS